MQEVHYQPTDWPKGYRCIVVRRWLKQDGNAELFPTHTAIMTSSNRLWHLEVLERHWKIQGFENGFKGPLREMNLHHRPTASLAGNQVYRLCGLIAQMVLSYLQYALLPNDAHDVGVRPLIRDVMRSVAKLTLSSGRYSLLFGKDHARFAWLTAGMRRYDVWWASAPG